ncbi:MAG: hypothetical protein PHI68_04955 [Candidatus Cloacimonetes bacterium]|nr:hypothetical protein [Candidatus Cloacimonadota bacterium]
MSKKKCPYCGSENTIKIVYGYPSDDLVQSAIKGTIKIGGRKKEPGDPLRVCKDCGKEFGGSEK